MCVAFVGVCAYYLIVDGLGNNKYMKVIFSFVVRQRVIARKCGGAPLAVKAPGSLMRYKSKWFTVKQSEM